jgi:hypothetical protein
MGTTGREMPKRKGGIERSAKLISRRYVDLCHKCLSGGADISQLEESVQVLTAQLEDARRQLGQAAFYSQPGNRPPGTPHSPQSKDTSQLQAENAYLRDENADLRRQLYNYRATYGQGPPEDVKADPSGFAYPHPPGTTSPRRNRSNDNPAGEGAGGGGGGDAPGSANSSSSNSYPHMDHFTSMQGGGGPGHNRSRSRVMSSSSAPSASPYLASDPRAVDSRYPGGPSMRYEAAQSGMYGQPGSHQIPRYDVPGGHPYAPRQEGSDSVSWPPEVSLLIRIVNLCYPGPELIVVRAATLFVLPDGIPAREWSG